ncbi:MAG: hypothetical protein QXH26_02635 [Candidatus Hadarchaeales archaeon]
MEKIAKPFFAPHHEAQGITLLQSSLLFTLLLAVSVGALFFRYHGRVTEASVALRAQELADLLSSRVSLAGLGTITYLDLPRTIEGEEYMVEAKNNFFAVRILSGGLSGREFRGQSPLPLHPSSLRPGSRIYFCPTSQGVAVSSEPVLENLLHLKPPSETPPQFYFFAKKRPEVAAGALWCWYMYGEEPVRYGGRVLQVNGSFLEIVASEESNGVSAWVIRGTQLAEVTASLENLPSVAEAENSGWVRSPSQCLRELRAREWRDKENVLVEVPENALILPCVVSTQTGRFVAWRVAWGEHTIYMGAMPWWWAEENAGFVYWSEKLRLG